MYIYKSIVVISKYVRISPTKVRRILDKIRGLSYKEALMVIDFLPYKACDPIWQLLYSAAANAKNNYALNKKTLVIDKAVVNMGPRLKRICPRAQGRAYAILKPTCHITIRLSEIT
mmetsp:Transcript_27990/g.43083  ORF Transcript_27990/g.43083 Transcript_27990/m.43083 type:complete len:116 (-) Transcript_27990:6211-6558(-)